MEKMLGVMLDCSRNAIMKPEKVKEFAQIIRKMGYNTLMLYTEDTYEIESQPYFGHLRGRYTKEELKDIDSFCNSIGIELVPCIQTLAHLNQMFKWKEVYSHINDCDDIILIGSEESYALIDEMIKTASECFTSRKIHLGMDEAVHVGLGKYKAKNDNRSRFDIINEHLHKVCSVAEKYGFEPMIWSDMFRRFAAGNLGEKQTYSDEEKEKLARDSALPQNITLVYWDYYSSDYNHYDTRIKTNQLYGRKVYFAGGAWTWGGFAPYNAMSIERTNAAVSACTNNGIDGIIMTVWGDDGAECSPFTILPSLLYAAERMKNNTDMEYIKKKFFEITGTDFDDFMVLDLFDTPGGKHIDNDSVSKYLFYNDPFMGLNDESCIEEDNEYYKNLLQKLQAASKNDFGYIFESYKKFAQVLSLKSALGIKTRKAYLANDKEALKNMIDEYKTVLKFLKEFHKAYQAYWFEYNKPHGFDIQDIRIGGLIQRVTSCMERLEKFVSGEVKSIPELEEKVLKCKTNFNPWCSEYHWDVCVSANQIGHNLMRHM